MWNRKFLDDRDFYNIIFKNLHSMVKGFCNFFKNKKLIKTCNKLKIVFFMPWLKHSWSIIIVLSRKMYTIFLSISSMLIFVHLVIISQPYHWLFFIYRNYNLQSSNFIFSIILLFINCFLIILLNSTIFLPILYM